MAEVDIWYEGDLTTRARHRETGVELLTDAPKDNQGKGRNFSPTDLVAVALGSCVLTLMGIQANRLKIDITGTKLSVSKEMAAMPARRIAKIKMLIICPRSFSPEIVERLKQAAENCPVHNSLHPDVIQEFVYQWGAV